MLTDFKMASLACICLFYSPGLNAKGDYMKLNFEGFEMRKWNIPTDTAQRVDQKNVVICLIIMFTSGVMVIKMSKMAHFLEISADDSKK